MSRDSPGSSSITTSRKVMLIISIIFAAFFTIWAFSGAIIYAFSNVISRSGQYNEHSWLRVTQVFCAIFEIILASVTLCQRTTEEGFVHVIANPQTVAQPIYQPGYQPLVQTGYQPGYQPGVQPQLQAQASPQTAPPPYTGQYTI